MKIIYFSWVRERIGLNSELINIQDNIKTLDNLIDFLSLKSSVHKEAISNKEILKFSVNFEFVNINHEIKSNDEVAIFQPVTGG